jgi:Flp pilus assembly protein TadG
VAFLRDEDGGPLVEAAVMIPILFTFLLGSVDFLFAFSQWNEATKAVEVGARLAAVSDPVANGLTGSNNIAVQAVTGSTVLGDPMPDFQVTCDGASAACTCTRGTCTGMGSYSAAAMNTIVYGRHNSCGTSACTRCPSASGYYEAGMCQFFPAVTASKVKVVYSQTGLGYAGRGAGPVPTITVSIQNIQFQYIFLRGLRGFTTEAMPALSTTVTGEALSSSAQ